MGCFQINSSYNLNVVPPFITLFTRSPFTRDRKNLELYGYQNNLQNEGAIIRRIPLTAFTQALVRKWKGSSGGLGNVALECTYDVFSSSWLIVKERGQRNNNLTSITEVLSLPSGSFSYI